MNKNTSKKNAVKKNLENPSKGKKKAVKKSEDKLLNIKTYLEQQHNNIHLINNIEQYQTLNAVRTSNNFNKNCKKFPRKSSNKDEKQKTLTKNNTFKKYKNINGLLDNSSNGSLNSKNNKIKKSHHTIETTSSNYQQLKSKVSSIKQINYKNFKKNKTNTKEINNNNNNIIINFFNAPFNRCNRDNFFNSFNNAGSNNINTTNSNHFNGIYKDKNTKKNILNININSINNLNNKEYKTIIPSKNDIYFNSNITNNNNDHNNRKIRKRCNTSENFIPLSNLNNFSSNNNNLRNNFKCAKNFCNNANYNKTITIGHRHVNMNTYRKNKIFLCKNKSIKKLSKNNMNDNSRDKYYMYYNKISEKNKIIKNNRYRNFPQFKLLQNMIFDNQNKLKIFKHEKNSMNKINKNNNTINLKSKKNTINISHSNTITNENKKESNHTYNFLSKILKRRNHSNSNHKNIINYNSNNNNNKNNIKKNNQQHFLSFNRFLKNEIKESTIYNDEDSKNRLGQKGFWNMKNSIDATKNYFNNRHFPIQRKNTNKNDNNINKFNKNGHNDLPFNINRNFLNTNSDNQNNDNSNNLKQNKIPNFNSIINNNNNNINSNNNSNKYSSNHFSHFNIGNNNKNITNKNNKNNKNETINNQDIKKNSNIGGIKVQNNTAVKIKPTQFKTNSDKIKKINEKSISPIPKDQLTIKTNKNSDPQYVEEYLDEILHNLFKEEKASIRELKFQMSSDFLNNYGINPETRTCLIDSLINLQKIFKFNERTLFITIQLFDKYIATTIIRDFKTIKEENLDMILTASLLVASKLEESLIYKLKDYLGILPDNYTVNNLIEMEDELLGVIHFNIVSPTMLDFFEIFCTKLKLDKKVKNQGLYLLNNILLDINLSQISGSVIAYSVINIITKNNVGSLTEKINEMNDKDKEDESDIEDENKRFFDAFFLLNNQEKINDLCDLIIVFSKGILRTEYINVFNKFNTEEFDFAAKIIEA